MNRLIIILAAFLFFLLPGRISANNATCTNRYVTLINPVRSRELWLDKTLNPLLDQYNAAQKHNYPVTWLLQYDTLNDAEVIDLVRDFDSSNEVGVFLEISKDLAHDAGVNFSDNVRWSDPSVVFLSGYTQSERRRLIDKLFSNFKNQFGFFPKSVGAWWIDSYSLNYIKKIYGLETVLIVADQKSTDSYGVWGQWWGYPYIPTKENVLVPAANAGLGSVVVQWAQRDPVLGFGPDASFSNFSLQANDYIRNGRDTEYFRELIETYLNCENAIAQITIGMETGMEAVYFHNEYTKQLEEFAKIQNLNVVTMSEFSREFKKRGNPAEVKIGMWSFTKTERVNALLNEKITYKNKVAFKDYFLPDKSHFLDRILPVKTSDKNGISKIYFISIICIVFLYSILKTQAKISLTLSFYIFTAFLPIFMAQEKYGWKVYYGFTFQGVVLYQTLLFLGTFTILLLLIKFVNRLFKVKILYLVLLPLSFGLDGLLINLRTSVIDGNRYIGFEYASTVYGVSIPSFQVKNLNGTVIGFLNRFPYEGIFNDPKLNLIIFPLIHIVVAGILYLLLRRINTKLRILILFILVLFYVLFVHTILIKDPVVVMPII